MTAAASLSSAFITDAIADFKGRLDTLMEESLTKYRGLTVAGLDEEYTPGYGEISELVGGSYTVCYQNGWGGGSNTYSLPTEIPPGKFGKDKGIWLIHSCCYKRLSYASSYSSGMTMSENGVEGFTVDNYGNVYNYQPSMSLSSWQVPLVGTETRRYPLPNLLIDFIKTLPKNLGHEIHYSTGTYQLQYYFLQSHIGPLVKLAAEAIYKSRQATLHLQRELAAEKAKTAALEADIRRLKSTGPPTVDLLGIMPTLNVVEVCPPTLNVVEVCPT